MKCPYCKNTIETVSVLEGKHFSKPATGGRYEKQVSKASFAFICPKCDTILSINSIS